MPRLLVLPVVKPVAKKVRKGNPIANKSKSVKQHPLRIVLVTSWPTEVLGGSGTAVFFNALNSGLVARGYHIELIAPEFDVTDYVEATLRRFLFNTELRTDPRIQSADVVIGFDYDGYGLDPANRPPMLTAALAVY